MIIGMIYINIILVTFSKTKKEVNKKTADFI